MANPYRLDGVDANVEIRRDHWGVPHVRAQNALDVWYGLGYACAQDRLWQIAWDRRRAVGRCSEVVGIDGIAADELARRLQLERSCRADVTAMSEATRAAFESYSAGINAWVDQLESLPLEFVASNSSFEPWKPWHSVAVFKIRHVLMGSWQVKIAQAMLLAMIGLDAYARLDARPPLGSPVIVPPGGTIASLFREAAEDVRAAARVLEFLGEVDAGSNSWAIHGSKTTTGFPVLCNDSHRQLDVPNVYWQAHVCCPEFDVIGATFPGLPGFPHFGHNGHVAWSVTHTMADYQDLYVEEFDTEAPGSYRAPGGWRVAARGEELIRVKDAPDVRVETWTTRHGPIVHGDPRTGYALALRYTATDGPCRTFEALGQMLRVRSVSELFESQREWVDPVNNLVCADLAGNIGYLARGVLPVRTSEAHRQFPTAGWTDENEWIGRIPFEDMPRVLNPTHGVIVTANQAVLETDPPYVSNSFSEPYRAERISDLLSKSARIDPRHAAAVQDDMTSTAAVRWIRFLTGVGPLGGPSEQARSVLTAWDGHLASDSPAALLYSCFRNAVAKVLFEPVVGASVWKFLIDAGVPAHQRMVRRWLATVVWGLSAGILPPDGSDWATVLDRALESAWKNAIAIGGDDPKEWRWGGVHRLAARHPLSHSYPALADTLDLPQLAVGGDGDTIRCAGYDFGDRGVFDVVLLSVYRQVVDFADVASSSFVIPGGASGIPGTPHYLDQLRLWEDAHRIPMLYGERAVEDGTQVETVLSPRQVDPIDGQEAPSPTTDRSRGTPSDWP